VAAVRILLTHNLPSIDASLVLPFKNAGGSRRPTSLIVLFETAAAARFAYTFFPIRVQIAAALRQNDKFDKKKKKEIQKELEFLARLPKN